MVNSFKKSILKFPPDLSFGFVPHTPFQFRFGFAIFITIKNLIPLYILNIFSKYVWTNDYESLIDTLPDVLKVLPYIPFLLIIFPLTAAENKFERNWEEFCSKDLMGTRKLYQKALPFTSDEFDEHNSKQDMFNKVLFYPGYLITVLGFTIIFPHNMPILFSGALIFFVHGFHTGYWKDLNARIRAKTIIEENNNKSDPKI